MNEVDQEIDYVRILLYLSQYSLFSYNNLSQKVKIVIKIMINQSEDPLVLTSFFLKKYFKISF